MHTHLACQRTGDTCVSWLFICWALIPLIGSNGSEEGMRGMSEQPLVLAVWVIRNRLLQISARSTSRARDDTLINKLACHS